MTMGPEPALQAVRKALSMGGHKAVVVTDPGLKGADSLVTARVLAAAVKRSEFDLVVAGVESTDGYTGTMPMAVAELLGIPALTFARKVEVKDGSVRVERQTETGYHVVESESPALITVTAGANDPRYPTTSGCRVRKPNRPRRSSGSNRSRSARPARWSRIRVRLRRRLSSS